MPFRVGRHQPRNIYWQPGTEPTDTDPQVGCVDTGKLGEHVVWALNFVTGNLPECRVCRRPFLAHQGQICSPEETIDG